MYQTKSTSLPWRKKSCNSGRKPTPSTNCAACAPQTEAEYGTFSFIDGPVTANNPMGVHHAWGRTYKDLYQRYQAMLGKNQRWQNGFDCQGLWVEVNVEKELGFQNKRDIEEYGLAEFMRLCKARVLKYAGVQTQQSMRLGYWMDWNDHG